MESVFFFWGGGGGGGGGQSEVVQGVTSDQHVCVQGGVYAICPGGLSEEGVNDMSEGVV